MNLDHDPGLPSLTLAQANDFRARAHTAWTNAINDCTWAVETLPATGTLTGPTVTIRDEHGHTHTDTIDLNDAATFASHHHPDMWDDVLTHVMLGYLDGHAPYSADYATGHAMHALLPPEAQPASDMDLILTPGPAGWRKVLTVEYPTHLRFPSPDDVPLIGGVDNGNQWADENAQHLIDQINPAEDTHPMQAGPVNIGIAVVSGADPANLVVDVITADDLPHDDEDEDSDAEDQSGPIHVHADANFTATLAVLHTEALLTRLGYDLDSPTGYLIGVPAPGTAMLQPAVADDVEGFQRFASAVGAAFFSDSPRLSPVTFWWTRKQGMVACGEAKFSVVDDQHVFELTVTVPMGLVSETLAANVPNLPPMNMDMLPPAPHDPHQ